MCDSSLHSVRTRPAKVGDSLTTRRFNMGTRGFSAPEDNNVAVCLLPGTELSFAEEIRRVSLWPWSKRVINHRTAIFRRINQDKPAAHHDALEFPDRQIVLLTFLTCGQQANILPLPVSMLDEQASPDDTAHVHPCRASTERTGVKQNSPAPFGPSPHAGHAPLPRPTYCAGSLARGGSGGSAQVARRQAGSWR